MASYEYWKNRASTMETRIAAIECALQALDDIRSKYSDILEDNAGTDFPCGGIIAADNSAREAEYKLLSEKYELSKEYNSVKTLRDFYKNA